MFKAREFTTQSRVKVYAVHPSLIATGQHIESPVVWRDRERVTVHDTVSTAGHDLHWIRFDSETAAIASARALASALEETQDPALFKAWYDADGVLAQVAAPHEASNGTETEHAAS